MTFTKRLVLVLVAVGILLVTAASALAAPPRSQPVVSGVVYGSDGLAIAGAPITVSIAGRRGVYGVVARLATDGNGRWTYRGKAGDYRFGFAAPSSDPATRALKMVDRGVYTLNVSLQSYGVITGAVNDAGSGEGLTDATVAFFRQNTDGSWPALPLAGTVSNGGAVYSSPQLPAGVYAVRVSLSGYVEGFFSVGGTVDTLAAATPVTVKRAVTASGTSVPLVPLVTVRGTVQGSDGSAIPLATVAVSLKNETGEYDLVASLATDGTGVCAYTGRAGEYELDISAPSADPATEYVSALTKGTYPLDVTLASYGTISGVVHDSSTGSPLAGATVEFYMRNLDSTWPSSPSATTMTPDGVYASAQLPAGSYRVRMTAPGFASAYYDSSGLGSPTTVVVNRDSAILGVDTSLTPVVQSAYVTGRVVNGAAAIPINGAFVWFYRQNADGSWPATSPGWGSPTKTVNTDAYGNYNSGELLLGTYRVRFYSLHTGSQWWMYVPTVDLATVVTLSTPGETLTGLDGWFNKPL